MNKILVFYQANEKHKIWDKYDHSIFVDGLDFNIFLKGININDFLYGENIHERINDNCIYLLQFLAENNKYYKEEFSLLSEALAYDDFATLFDLFDVIQIDYDIDNGLEEFLKNNKEWLVNKKILLPFKVYFDKAKVKEVIRYKELISKYIPNPHIVCIPYLNEEDEKLHYFVDIQDYLDAYQIREDLLNLIRSLNLSPLEQITFIYDYLKNKKYVREDADDPWYVSRDVISVLTGKKIVCMGFVALFKSLIDELQNTSVYSLTLKKVSDSSRGHERAIVYIKDDKYGVDGNYIFDMTFEAKSEKNMNNENDYYFFLRTLKEMNIANEHMGYKRVNATFLDEDIIKKIDEELPDVFTEEEFKKVIDNKRVDYNAILIGMNMSLFWLRKEGNKKEDILRIYKLIYESFNRDIDYQTIIRLFYNVRRVEYYLVPNEALFSLSDVVNMAKTNLATPLSTYSNTVDKMKNESNDSITRYDIMDGLVKETIPSIEKDIKKIELTRTLRSYLENKREK